MNMVRSMLSGKRLLKTFWPEAINWTVHILNRSHTLAIAKELSLMTRAKKCVFLGVSEESKAYRLYDPVSNKIIVSRDVVFDEEASWDWEKSHKESVLINLDWGESETLPDATTLPGTSNGAGIDATSEHNEPG
nr:hypothetical protein [Tanacetum cinerariifolium]